MRSEAGFRRLVNFSDAVVAIAITLLVLPLVDSASSIGSTGVGAFLSDNKTKLFAFVLSFAVIGRFWWAQHQMHESVKSYNSLLVGGVFLWLVSIVFLPFPTELLSSAKNGGRAAHAVYIGTMLVTAVAALMQQLAVVRWPELQDGAHSGRLSTDAAVATTVLMATAFALAVSVEAIGLWALLLLLLSTPLERLLASRRTA
ncbi:MAG: TMEM175 family protein [Acidimicrobiales bacterium]